MTWDGSRFTVPKPGMVNLPGAAVTSPKGDYVTIQDLIDFGLLTGVNRIPTTAAI